MDTVSRLKTFISHLNIPVTQFADMCNIPRPTLSQLLNGRNKKVSDELIRKLHGKYPKLNITWLLFGEGDMLTNENIKFSEPQNTSQIDFSEEQHPVNETTNGTFDFGEEYDEKVSEKYNEQNHDIEVPLKPSSIAFDTDQTKKIVNIIIYYNDNSFESFIPGYPKK
ncbi:MAG: helix-turn-helix domain-containing protein [Paramuribaculum sp.]|nr:helix-turn-helix domain-containing protein [Paramuribaculum sp.]